MEWLGCLAVFIGVAVLRFIFNAISGSSQNRAIEKTVQEEIKVRWYGDQLTTDSGETKDYIRVTASGTCAVPEDNYPCRIHFKAVDITNGLSEDAVLPILSLLPGMADENGMLSTSTEVTMPYQLTSFEEVRIGVLVPDGLVLARRGTRRLRILTWITPDFTTEPVFKFGSLDMNFEQRTHGYLERDERDLEEDKILVQLAVILCNADGVAEDCEVETIQRFFKQRMINRDEAEEHREKIAQTLTRAMQYSDSQGGDVRQLIRPLARKLLKFEDNGICQDAYELCAQIVAADNRVNKDEQLTLGMVAKELNISTEVQREIHDRHFSMNMFRERSREALLDMPAGLSTIEQITFLNREYQKWRSSVNYHLL